MAEVSLPEEPIASSTSTQNATTINQSESSRITVRIDDEEEDVSGHVESVASNSNCVEKGEALMHDHNYGNCSVPRNSADPFYGQNGDPFPLLEGLGDYVDNTQSKAPLGGKIGSIDQSNTSIRAIHGFHTGSGLTPVNYFDSKSRDEMLKRRSVSNVLNRPGNDVFLLGGRNFDNNRILEQKKLQPGASINKFPIRSAIKPGGLQHGVALTRQFSSPNSASLSGDQINPNIAIYQQRPPNRIQQPIILKATPRILQPVSTAYSRRQPMPRQNVIPARKTVTDEESAILNVVDEEEMRNQTFFQKQSGNQTQSKGNQLHPRQVTTSISGASDEGTDPHGYFHKFQNVRHPPTNIIQTPPRQDFARQSYAAQPKQFYPSSQNQQQFGRLSQPGVGQSAPSFLQMDQQGFGGSQPHSLQSPVRPRIRKPLIETTESPQRTPKPFISPPTSAPKTSGRGRKKKEPDVEVEKKMPKKKANESHNENDLGEREGVDYVTRCLCEMKHNDPNMIACDKCGVWQHMSCMGVSLSSASKNAEYFCEQCKPRALKNTHEQAKSIQKAYLQSLRDKSKNRKSIGKSTDKLNKSNGEKLTPRSSISTSASVSKPENKFVETKITRGIRKIIDKLDSGNVQLVSKLGEPSVKAMVVAPEIYGVVSNKEIPKGDPVFEYKASLSLRDERGSQSLSTKFFGNLIYFVPGKSGEGGELIFADASRHSDMLSAKLRKSCQPNAIIQHVITKNREDEDILRLFVVAKEPIEEFTEITIPLDLEYRGTEIAELDCACRTTDFAAKIKSFAPGCPVAEYIQKKESEVVPDAKPVQAERRLPVERKAPVEKKSSPPKQQTSTRRRTASNQQQSNAASKPDLKSEVSPPSTKTPTPLPMELEIANILSQDLPRSNSNTGTTKSLTSSPTRRSPAKATTSASAKGKKITPKTKKETLSDSSKKPGRSSKRSDIMPREIASLFDDNKFMSSSFDAESATPGRSLRHRTQVKHEGAESPNEPSSSTTAPQSNDRKRVLSQASASKTPVKKPRHSDIAKKTGISAEQFTKSLNKLSSIFTISSEIRAKAKKSKLNSK